MTAYPPPASAVTSRRHKPVPLPDVDLLSRAIEKVGPIGLGGALRELGVSAA